MTHPIVTAAKAELELLSKPSTGGHLRTGEIRRLSARLFRDIRNEPKEHVFAVCGELLEQRGWALGVIAYDFAYRVRKQYDAGTFALFEGWLETYVRGWGDCDDFCTHAFGELVCQDTALASRVFEWTKRGEFWMRRASAVVLIPSIWRGQYAETEPLRTADALMADEHDLVRKGYGWMLKALSLKEPALVFAYLQKHRAVMPRVAYRYALEKLDTEQKRILMSRGDGQR